MISYGLSVWIRSSILLDGSENTTSEIFLALLQEINRLQSFCNSAGDELELYLQQRRTCDDHTPNRSLLPE